MYQAAFLQQLQTAARHADVDAALFCQCFALAPEGESRVGAVDAVPLTLYPEHGLASYCFHFVADFDVANSNMLRPDLNAAAAAATAATEAAEAAASWVQGPH